MKPIRLTIAAGIIGALLLVPTAAFGHAHRAANAADAAKGDDPVLLANGQNHPKFINGESCEEYGPLPGSSIGPAWYGLETAHHGPDQGDPGKGDGCYYVEGGPLTPENDRNPGID